MGEMKRALIIVDVQEAFDDEKWGQRNNLNAEANISQILKACREKEWLIIHIQHISDNVDSVFHPKSKGFAIKKIVEPIEGEVRVIKKVNSGFIGTNLEDVLKENAIIYCPGKAANAGGVAVSALEMAQNAQRLPWTFEQVDHQLNQIMKNIYETSRQTSLEYVGEFDLVAGANIAGFARVAEAMVSQGLV